MTYTGRQFFPLTPRQEDIDIEDIAHSLSRLCRFNGHCKSFYSVAEHSYRISYIVPPEFALWGLLHDAGEAYLSDLPRPIKHQIPEFIEIEERLLKDITKVYDTNSMESAVKTSYKIAKHGEVVLLSPACKSFDLFKNFEDRGKQFKKAVRNL